jgi:hypothetical protein
MDPLRRERMLVGLGVVVLYGVLLVVVGLIVWAMF